MFTSSEWVAAMIISASSAPALLRTLGYDAKPLTPLTSRVSVALLTKSWSLSTIVTSFFSLAR